MNRTEMIESVVADQLRAEGDFPAFSVGDTLNVHVRIIEGGKERIQVYQGVLIAQKGRGINTTITVRRIVANEGVERIFPLHGPRVKDVLVTRRGDVRRAKLYFLRDRVGKSTRVKELLGEKVRRDRLAEKQRRSDISDAAERAAEAARVAAEEPVEVAE